jgi:hypothetical protein
VAATHLAALVIMVQSTRHRRRDCVWDVPMQVAVAREPVDRALGVLALVPGVGCVAGAAVGNRRLVGMTSVLSLSVEGLRVIVRIDGDDVSRSDGNDGPDPWHVLVLVNRFVATGEPTTATIACCPNCGPECVAVVARIRREGDTVRWEWGRSGARWEGERRTTLFDAAAYDAEVARIGADHGWETAERRVGRLVLTGLVLPTGIEGVRVNADRSGELEVWLEEPGEYQVLVGVPWDEERPDESAAEVRAVLAGPAARWPARWHSIKGGREEDPPAYASPSWQLMEF